jgi:hypothetical protein
MIKYLLYAVVSVIFSAISFSQSSPDYPAIEKEDFPEANSMKTREFSGNALYGYIDGGADLYLEYGFSGVRITEFTAGQRKYKVEVYRMKNPEAGYGIFSVSRFRCKSRPDFSTCTCLNKYQLQVYKGDFYISIINETGTPADSILSIKIGERLASLITGKSFDPSEFFPGISPGIVRNESYLVKGRLGILNGAPQLDEYFRNSGAYTAAIMITDKETMVSVRFDSRDLLDEFSKVHRWAWPTSGNSAVKMPGGESVMVLHENHVLIIWDN